MMVLTVDNDMIAQGLIATGIAKLFHGAGNEKRIDDVAPAGAPGTVTLPTGHVLSVPVAGAELLMGYIERTQKQTELDARNLGAFVIYQGVLHGNVHALADWPKMADEFACLVMGRANPYVQ